MSNNLFVFRMKISETKFHKYSILNNRVEVIFFNCSQNIQRVHFFIRLIKHISAYIVKVMPFLGTYILILQFYIQLEINCDVAVFIFLICM